MLNMYEISAGPINQTDTLLVEWKYIDGYFTNDLGAFEVWRHHGQILQFVFPFKVYIDRYMPMYYTYSFSKV